MPIDVAFGVLSDEFEDVILPGKVNLCWTRRYSSGMPPHPTSPLGPGWSVQYFATLTHHEDCYELFTPEGNIELFLDSENTVERGAIVRNLGTFKELFKRGKRYVVRSWNVETGQVKCFTFVEARREEAWPLASVEDVTGHGLDLFRDNTGRLTSIRQRLEKRALTITYTVGDLVDGVVLTTSNAERYQLIRYQYDAAGRLAAAYDAAGDADRYEYDEHHRLTRKITKDGGVFSFRYDERGRCIRSSGLDRYDEKTLKYLDAACYTQVTDSYGNSTLYKYLPTGKIVSSVDPLGGEKQTFYDEHGRITAKQDANGTTAYYEFDDSGNRKTTINPLGQAYTYRFDSCHQPLIMIDPSGNTWKWEYTDDHRLCAIENPLGERWTIRYDAYGNANEIINPCGARKRQLFEEGVLKEATDWAGNSCRYRFDGFGRMVERTGPRGEKTVIAYDLLGYPTGIVLPDGSTTRFTHDSAGNLTSVIDGDGRITRYRFGQCRRLLERVGRNGEIVKYLWGTEPDWLDQVVNEKGEVHTFFRDAGGRVIRECAFDGREQQFRYDRAGHCVSLTNGIGEAITLKRDAIGRLVERLLPDGSFTKYEYDPLGNVISAVNQDSSVVFERDSVGRILRESQGEHWIERRYDAVGNPVHMETNLGHTVHYDLDANGRMNRLTTLNDQVLEFAYNGSGQEVTRVLPGYITLRQAYDLMGRLVEQWIRLKESSRNNGLQLERTLLFEREIAHRLYTYGQDNTLRSIRDQQFGKVDYEYDSAERLVRAVGQDGFREAFQYDVTGNISRIQTEGQSPIDEALIYAPGNRISQKDQTQYEFDTHGRLVKRTENAEGSDPQVWSYSWDALDQLRSVTRPGGQLWQYKYDALGRRIKKIGPEQVLTYVWDRNVVTHEISEKQKITSWIFSLDSLAPLAVVYNEHLYPVVNDHLGTPRELIDPRGHVVWSASYTAWGAMRTSSTDKITCPIRFQGHWYDEESGLHYNRFRYYDPSCARYISSDPIGLAGGLNQFAYTPNPITWIDPFGLAKVCEKALQEAVDHAVENIPGLSREQAEAILRGAFSRDSSAVFGGSRVRGDFRPDSDIDVGFGSLSTSQAGKVIDKAAAVPGGLSVEQTRIVPGNTPPNIPTIQSPEQFFMSSGVRGGGDPKAGQPYTPSGYISYAPDGSIQRATPDGQVTQVK